APGARSQRDPSEVPDQERASALASVRHDDLLDVLRGSDAPLAANHELGPGDLEQAAAPFVVACANRFDDACEGDAVGEHRIRIEAHLILAYGATDRRDLRYAGHRLEVVSQQAVLDAAQGREVVRSGFVAQRVLVDPSDARRVGAELGPNAVGESGQD